MSTVWLVVFASRTGTEGDGVRDTCLENAITADSREETPGRDTGLDLNEAVGGGGRGCDGGPVKESPMLCYGPREGILRAALGAYSLCASAS